ncbi:putative F-box protein PP2-B12 isoform X1 [Spinacia oleracea]|uniref:F-box protein PP2-B12 isoform X1 n=2 Tax=Spinacia oleracea TaxID=3562 RepID=A0A9R0JXR5_SPIOL|nr:putative F-box protein PP2-B12 isoform X1 [Spinacia oleracea]
MSCTNILDLPEECLSHILSLTSPADIVRSSAVSKLLLSASDSDFAWEKFMPSDTDRFVSQQSSTPFDQQKFASKRYLYFRLCSSPILLDHSYSKNGTKSYMLGARALKIAWEGTPQRCNWKYVPESRFLEIVEPQTDYDVCCLEIKGRIHTKLLSPDTTYGVYFVYKTDNEHAYRFEHVPFIVSLTEVDEEDLSKNDYFRMLSVKKFYLKTSSGLHRKWEELPDEREDGWMEIEMGMYKVGSLVKGTDQRVILELTLKEVQCIGWKSGLIVQGIELLSLLD